MRDGNRLKEKIELQLDRRQVTSLSVVALLLSASIFALGVMVGKNLVPVPRAGAPAEALLDRLDAQAVRPDAGEGESLTFQDELTKKLPPTVVPAAKPAKPAAPSGNPLPAAPGPGPQVPGAPAPAPTAVAAALIDAGGIKAAVLNELKEKDSGVEVAVAAKPSVPHLSPAPSAAPKSFFTIQVKATQSSTEADKFAKKLKGQGYQSLVAEAEVEGKGKWYRVRVGKFDTRPQADHYLVDFKRETHLEAFVTAAGH